MTIDITDISLYRAMADELNAHPEKFTVLGECDMVLALVMRADGGDFAVRIRFEGLRCEAADEVDAAEASLADYYLDGPLPKWQAMFDDIVANGAASGRLTINSLALLATSTDDIRLRGDDPMGTDKFSRFNQTLQEYLDGAARVAVAA
ncbi:MAG: hypothetical protein U0Q03_12580 [Acidimicrobiales bacterium]